MTTHSSNPQMKTTDNTTTNYDQNHEDAGGRQRQRKFRISPLHLALLLVCAICTLVVSYHSVAQQSLTRVRRRQRQQQQQQQRRKASTTILTPLSTSTSRQLGNYNNYNNNNYSNNAKNDDDDGTSYNNNGNYLWARDDDDDYYAADDDGSYWEANLQYSSSTNSGGAGGGSAIQGDYSANYDSQNFDDNYEINDASGAGNGDDGAVKNDKVNRMGYLTYNQRQWLAVSLAVTMVLLLVCFLFGPILLEKVCSCCRQNDHKKTQTDLVTQFAELGNF